MAVAFWSLSFLHGCWIDGWACQVQPGLKLTTAIAQGCYLKIMKACCNQISKGCTSDWGLIQHIYENQLPKMPWHCCPTEDADEAIHVQSWCCKCFVESGEQEVHQWTDGLQRFLYTHEKLVDLIQETIIYLRAFAKPKTSVVSLPWSVLIWMGIP